MKEQLHWSFDMNIKCPKCKTSSSKNILGVEYWYAHPEHYDGISEWNCNKCGTRWGRWTGQILKEGQWEPRGGNDGENNRRSDKDKQR